MGWLKVDDGFLDHRKVVGLSKDALLLWFAGSLECARQLTDGHLSAPIVARLMRRDQLDEDAAHELVEAELWHTDGHACERCPPVESRAFVVHDYLEWNPTAERERARRAQAKERTKRWRDAAKAKRDASRDASRMRSPSPYPSPSRSEGARDGCGRCEGSRQITNEVDLSRPAVVACPDCAGGDELVAPVPDPEVTRRVAELAAQLNARTAEVKA